jgi:hypothetical protein
MSVGLARRAAAVALGLSLIVFPAAASAATPDDASEASARAFVQGFYDWYLKRVLAAGAQREKHPDAKGFDFIDAIRQRPDWFSPELKRLLEEDYAASSRCKGDVVGLDWDPFLETQDPAPTYTAGKVEKTAKGFRVSVDFHNKNYAGVRNPAAQADVALVGGHWTFVDFVQEPTDPKSRQGLVALLKGYERSGEYKCQH